MTSAVMASMRSSAILGGVCANVIARTFEIPSIGYHIGRDKVEQDRAILVETQIEDVARSRQVDIDNLFDAPRRRRHDHHTVGEIDRLLDIVSDEDHCLLRTLDNVIKVMLEL